MNNEFFLLINIFKEVSYVFDWTRFRRAVKVKSRFAAAQEIKKNPLRTFDINFFLYFRRISPRKLRPPSNNSINDSMKLIVISFQFNVSE